MKVWFKRILISVVILAIVALVGLAIFLLTFDPNAYKNKLEALVYNRYHRTLVIEGDIELSLFPRIGLSVQGVSISDRNSTSTFASIDSVRFAVAIWPLLSNRLVVDHVAVTGFKAWVTRNKEGEFNFQDLIKRPPPARELSMADAAVQARAEREVADTDEANPESRALLAVINGPKTSHTDLQIDIAGLTLKNGEIHLYDVITGSVARIEKLDVDTGRMTFNQPFDVALKGKLTADYPVADANIDAQALVQMNPGQKTYSAKKLNLQISGLLGTLQAKTASLRGNIAYSAYSRLLTASSLELLLQGEMKGEHPVKKLSASLTVPQLKIDQSQAEVEIEKLAFRAKGDRPVGSFDVALDAPSLAISPDTAKSEAISATVKLNGNSVLGVALSLNGLGGNAHNLTLKELTMEGGLKQGDRLIQFDISSPAKWDTWKDQGRLSAIKGDVKIEASALPDGSFQFPLIGSVHADLKKDEVVSEINAVINGSKLDFTATATRLKEPKVVFDLQADSLDFNKLFPPTVVKKEKSAQAKEAQVQAEPAVNKESQEKTPAKPGAAKAAVAQPGAKPSQPAGLDLSILDVIDVSGKIKIGEIKVRNLQAKTLSAAVQAGKGKLEVSKIRAELYKGTLNAAFAANADNVMAARISLDSVQVGDLLKGLIDNDRLSGVGNVLVDLHTDGSTAQALKAGLTGSVQTRLRDGSIRGYDVAQTLRKLNQAVLSLSNGKTPDLSTKFDIGQQTQFTALDAKVVFDKGRGMLKKLNVQAPLLRISEGKPASVDLIDETLDLALKVHVVNTLTGQNGKNLAVLQGLTVPVLISGPFDAPAYEIQWQGIGDHLIKRALHGGVVDLLSGQLAGKPGPKSETAPTQAQEPTPEDTVKNIGKALKGLFE